ncbi:MAG: hypothetical protein ACE5EH_09230 [Gammaproteobacteria bacterium]
MSYQEHLKTLSREDGLMAKIKRSSTSSIKQMLGWNYKDDRIFEIKYEDIMSNEEGVLNNYFRTMALQMKW